MGGVRLAGRDLLLAATLIALGIGAVGVQYVVMSNWRDQIARGIDRSLARIEAQFVDASNERELIIQQLRLRNCAEALGLKERKE